MRRKSGYAHLDVKSGKWLWTQLIKRDWKDFAFVKRLEADQIFEEFEMIAPLVRTELAEVTVPQDLHDEILYEFIPRWKSAKLKEGRFQMDHDRMTNRALTGFLGEAAVEVLLGTPVLDRGPDGRIVVEDSRKFHAADLSKTGLDVGVKTVEWGKFPVVKRNVKRPQMIGFKMDERTFLIGGYASMKVLREHQSSVYVINDNLRNKRTWDGQIEKISFWGFHKLQQVRSLEDLRKHYYTKGK